MILGGACTRNCRFCAVHSGVPEPVDADEPGRVAEAVARLELRHVVVTSVTRDDLPDGGAAHFIAAIEAIRTKRPDATVEVLTPDFHVDRVAIARVLAAGPDVFGHNIETVERLYPGLRGAAHSYARALDVLRIAREESPETLLKSALMVGHGETADEVRRTLADLLDAGCRALCIGQYLQPTPAQSPVAEFVEPAVFEAYEAEAHRLGFRFALAGPFVRSSYRSEELMEAVSDRER
jgi:lipoic acid synthetase